MALGTGVAEEDANLAVGDLAQRATVLAGDAHRVDALLGEPGLVDHEDARGVAQRGGDCGPEVVPDRVGIPDGAVQDPLHATRMGIPGVFGQLPPILAVDLSEQPAQVITGMAGRLGAPDVAAQQVQHAIDRLSRGGRHRHFTDTPTSSIVHLISPPLTTTRSTP